MLALVALECLRLPAQNTDRSDVPIKSEAEYVPVHAFDPARNAAADIDRAIVEARKTGRRILLDVGGDWCPWCHALDQLFQAHPDLLQLREDNFITVAVYCGPDKKNAEALSHYSKVLGIPHFFVLDSDGTLLHSQHVAALQLNGTYRPEKMREFLIKWSPTTRNPEKADSHKSQ